MTQATALRVQAFTTGDVAAQCRATPGWVQHYQQMSPGHFAGQIRYLDLHGVEVYEESMNTRVEQHFNAPPGALAFCFDGSDNALYLLNGESRNTWITPENYREVAVVFGPQFVQRHRLDVAKLEGLFMAPLTCQQNALFSRWLSGTLTRLSGTTDPISRDALTQQLLDDCLFILDNACVCLDRQ
ncbi:AraC family transcriptional regulator, partial [Pseudomonas sp. KHB2.9]